MTQNDQSASATKIHSTPFHSMVAKVSFAGTMADYPSRKAMRERDGLLDSLRAEQRLYEEGPCQEGPSLVISGKGRVGMKALETAEQCDKKEMMQMEEETKKMIAELQANGDIDDESANSMHEMNHSSRATLGALNGRAKKSKAKYYCPDCWKSVHKTTYSEGVYSSGWVCSNFANCNARGQPGTERYCCAGCLFDFCNSCAREYTQAAKDLRDRKQTERKKADRTAGSGGCAIGSIFSWWFPDLAQPGCDGSSAREEDFVLTVDAHMRENPDSAGTKGDSVRDFIAMRSVTADGLDGCCRPQIGEDYRGHELPERLDDAIRIM